MLEQTGEVVRDVGEHAAAIPAAGAKGLARVGQFFVADVPDAAGRAARALVDPTEEVRSVSASTFETPSGQPTVREMSSGPESSVRVPSDDPRAAAQAYGATGLPVPTPLKDTPFWNDVAAPAIAESMQWLESQKPARVQAAGRRFAKTASSKDAYGPLDQVVAVLKAGYQDPGQIVLQAIESAPSMIAPAKAAGAVGEIAARRTLVTAQAMGVNEQMAKRMAQLAGEAAVKKHGANVAAAVGGVQSGEASADQFAAGVDAMSDAELTAHSPMVQQRVRAGESIAEIRDDLKTQGRGAALAVAGVLTTLSGRFSGAAGFEAQLGAAAVGRAARSAADRARHVAAKVGEGVRKEGLQEGFESGGERGAENLAMQTSGADPTKPLGEGVAATGTQGILLGALMGGGAGGIQAAREVEAAGPQPADAATTQPGFIEPPVATVKGEQAAPVQDPMEELLQAFEPEPAPEEMQAAPAEVAAVAEPATAPAAEPHSEAAAAPPLPETASSGADAAPAPQEAPQVTVAVQAVRELTQRGLLPPEQRRLFLAEFARATKGLSGQELERAATRVMLDHAAKRQTTKGEDDAAGQVRIEEGPGAGIGDGGREGDVGEGADAAPPAGDAVVPDGAGEPQPGAEASRPAEVADTSGNVRRVSTADIKVSPEEYQFRSKVDEKGTDDRLQAVKKWDDVRAGVVILHERKDGQVFVADGHHRIELAKRAGQPDVNAMVFREADGHSVADVRRIAALKNLSEGNATPIDAAKAFRGASDIDKMIEEENLPKNAATRHGAGLAKLSQEAFDIVVSGNLQERDGAVIGERFTPDQHVAAVKVFQKVQPQTMQQAEILASQIKQAGFGEEKAEQVDMFGAAMQDSLLAERVNLIDTLARQLRNDRAVFAGLDRNATRIEGTGKNQLDRETNKAIADESARMADHVTRLAATDQTLSQALNDGARRLKEGESAQSVVKSLREVLTNVAPTESRPNSEVVQSGGEAVRREAKSGTRSQKSTGDARQPEGPAKPLQQQVAAPAPGATPARSGKKPLSDIKVKRSAVETDTGRKLKIKQRADDAIADVDQQISTMRGLIQCLRT